MAITEITIEDYFRQTASDVQTVEQAEAVSVEWVKENIDPEAAWWICRNRQYSPPPNHRVRPWKFTMPPLGTWRMDEMGEFDVLVSIPVAQIQPSEGEWEFAINYPSTRTYVQWAKRGHTPPPPWALRNVNGELRLTSGRRRWLAAREAGVSHLICWYSGPCHEEHRSRSKWWLPELGPHYIGQVGRVSSLIKGKPGGKLRDYFSQYQIDRFNQAGLFTQFGVQHLCEFAH